MDKKNIETIYPLTPLQQAFLWHSLQTSVQDGLIHMRCTLRGEVNISLLQQAWEFVVGRHPALRTSVHWEGVKQPLQVVARQASIPWTQLDWRGREDQQAALAEFLVEDRDRSFNLTEAPISRLALIRLSETNYELVWSCHHLMLDGWSGALVFNQAFDAYESLRQGQSPVLETVPSYQKYVRWLKQQDEAAAEEFWREALQGFGGATELPVYRGGSNGEKVNGYPGPQAPKSGGFESYPPQHWRAREAFDNQVSFPSVTFSPRVTAGVQEMLRSHHLTLNTLIQGIWALLLHSYSDNPDVVFGATVSGRQADLDDVESIVGMLINVLPVRVKIAVGQTVLDWLQTLQSQQAMASRYAYASLDQIQGWSETSGRLFDSLLVIENYPMQTAARSLQVENMQSGLVSTYGLTVIVKPGDALTIMLQADEPYRQALLILLKQFEQVLLTIIRNPEQSVGGIVPPQDLLVVEQPPKSVEDSAVNLSRDQLEGSFFAPSNPLELKLTQIWKSVLGVSSLSVEDSFFNMGGNSLLAVQLFNEMQQQLDCALPLATLFQAPNVRQFAALLSQDQPVSQWSSLVPIQTNGAQTPLFFHGGSADALTWARFSHLLGTERPFYALQRPDLDGSEVTHTTVEALATDCVKEMRMVRPKGPYLVGGHCLGGAVAFEIAQQLQADGEDVASVVLIDSYRPGELPETVLTQLQSRFQLGVFWVRKNYYYHGGWEKLASLPGKVWQKLRPSEVPPLPPMRGDFETDQDSSNLVNSEDSSPVAKAANSEQPTPPYEYRYARAQKANELAAERYVPQPYIGRVKLFRAEIQILDWYFGRELGWQVVAKDGVEVTKIPGFFGNLFNQQATPLLVGQVRDYLSQLE
ncbi:amino acid adenylation domain protein [Leptolyngbya sp. Heron Island J]|uniref:alpha/beta fold hydrolase n=1 Tax=Leptolyngbya sp. Heron Island J TaxID=1385935 RepID=UPI0003B995DC|nr:alpha/beta fold hydrolase [Leptolyngbya sp. Heron Island J]ESA38546.1 amino acid adenylation domain protein [Leptolyngbya sp. Heron Island J]